MGKIISNSPEETIEYGKKLAASLKVGDVIVLSGDLGSGKTKLTEGILSFFGLQDDISSPTFTIVNEYHTPNLNIFHFDVYRLEDAEEFSYIGGEEYFEKGASIIEWGERIEELLPNEYTKITFSRDLTHENRRILEIEKVFHNSSTLNINSFR